ncbi:MAG: SDR family oxidoreductase [Rhodospirillaceae bacterium]|nr:SDR family oxidoreductase [Rhodospirillaceae bacterium]
MTNVLITGAGRGIGLELARRFLAAGARVNATVRDMAKADSLRSLGNRVTINVCDVTSDADVSALAEGLADKPIDVLINNAGILLNRGEAFGNIDLEAFEEVLRVNTIAPIRVAQAFADNVAASSKKLIVNVSSRMGSIGEGGVAAYSYRASKAALNMAMTTIAKDLEGQGVTVIVVHPGWVRTDMGGSSASLSVEESVDGLMHVIDSVSMVDTGSFFNYDGTSIQW